MYTGQKGFNLSYVGCIAVVKQSCFHGSESNSPVHGSCIDVGITQFGSDQFGICAFPTGRVPVEGYNNFPGFKIRFFVTYKDSELAGDRRVNSAFCRNRKDWW